jgi:hypothetical protein
MGYSCITFFQAFLQLYVAKSAGGHVGSETDVIPSVWIGLNDMKVYGGKKSCI